MGLDIKDDWPLLVGGLLVVFAIMYAVSAKGGSSNATVSYQTVGADPAITAEETSMYAAKQQTVQSLFSGLFGLEAVKSNNATTVTDTNTMADVAKYEAGLASTTALGEAAYSSEGAIISSGNELTGVQTLANDQLSAAQAQAHASQQNGFWNALFGGVSAVAKDFSNPGALFGGGGSSGFPSLGGNGMGLTGEDGTAATYNLEGGVW